jgi:hypothetical protein
VPSAEKGLPPASFEAKRLAGGRFAVDVKALRSISGGLRTVYDEICLPRRFHQSFFFRRNVEARFGSK